LCRSCIRLQLNMVEEVVVQGILSTSCYRSDVSARDFERFRKGVIDNRDNVRFVQIDSRMKIEQSPLLCQYLRLFQG